MFHEKEIELSPNILNPIISILVINQLHKSSSILLTILRFYECVSRLTNLSSLYLRLLQVSYGGYVASISSSNNEYQQRWSAYIFFQLPRLLASSFETQFDNVKRAIENFLLYNEYLLDRIDELCLENVLEQLLQTALDYTKIDVKEQNQNKINELKFHIQKTREPFVQRIQECCHNQQTC